MSRHLEKEISKLKGKITQLSDLVEERLHEAVTALETRNAELAQAVVDGDLDIDQLEVEIEEDCLKILALHQPVAIDLRYIITVLKMNNDLERIGDLAANIAERALYLSSKEAIGIPFDLAGMARKVQSMLGSSLEALVNMDTALAIAVCLDDQEVDDIHRDVYRKVEAAMRENDQHLDFMITLLTVARNLERIADHATNIAEDVLYLVEGEIRRHQGSLLKSHIQPAL
jgi:phosphate transport system protein